ncbi:MAG: AIR synthase-related protein, partial [Candidatus Woesearchaeota archaeon]
KRGLVASCTSVGIGGIGVALAKTAIGGQLGMKINLDDMYIDRVVEDSLSYADDLIFSESQGRFIVTVDPAKADLFEAALNTLPYSQIGMITDDGMFTVFHSDEEYPLINTSIDELTESYKKTLRDY